MDLDTHFVWERFSQQLKYFILKRVNDEMDTEDILQDVFLKIHQHIHTLRDDERLLPWLYQITRNTIIDHYRTKRVKALPLDEDLVTVSLPGSFAADEIASSLKGFIEELPDKYRQALMLTEFENVSQKDLAQRLALSNSGARSRVQRGRALLKQSLEDCCKFTFDHYGQMLDYTPRANTCCNESDASPR